jgi:hypothetical protein
MLKELNTFGTSKYWFAIATVAEEVRMADLDLYFANIRYIIHPWDAKSNLEAIGDITHAIEELIKDRENRGHPSSIASPMKALKASLWYEPRLGYTRDDCTIDCYLHQGFQWGYTDIAQILRQIRFSFGTLVHSRRLLVTLDLRYSRLIKPLGSIPSDSVNFANLEMPRARRSLYPAGIIMRLRCDGLRDNEPGWAKMLYGAFKALYSLVLVRNIAEEGEVHTKLVLLNISKKRAMASVKMVNRQTADTLKPFCGSPYVAIAYR